MLCRRQNLEDVQGRVRAWQARIAALTYDLPGDSGAGHHAIRRCPTMAALGAAAAAILERGAPIRCQEGVVLAAYLSAEVPGLLRLPLSFKTRIAASGVEHRHIVLCVREPSDRRWGSMGISRSPGLMDKPLDSPTLSALVRRFELAYAAVGHELAEVNIGLPLSSSRGCLLPIRWRALHVPLHGKQEKEGGGGAEEGGSAGWTGLVDAYEGSLSALVAHHARTLGQGVPSPVGLRQLLEAKKGPLRMHDLMLLGSPPPPKKLKKRRAHRPAAPSGA